MNRILARETRLGSLFAKQHFSRQDIRVVVIVDKNRQHFRESHEAYWGHRVVRNYNSFLVLFISLSTTKSKWRDSLFRKNNNNEYTAYG